MSNYLRKCLSPNGQTYYQTCYYRTPTTLTRERKMLVLGFEYNAELVERIKADIAWHARHYRWDSQDWAINPAYEKAIIRLVKSILDEDITVTGGGVMTDVLGDLAHRVIAFQDAIGKEGWRPCALCPMWHYYTDSTVWDGVPVCPQCAKKLGLSKDKEEES